MSNKLYHVGIRWSSDSNSDALEKLLDTLDDWYRLNAWNYYIWTDKSSLQIHQLIDPVLGEKDYDLIFEINSRNRNGAVPQATWDWLNKKRDFQKKT